MFILSPLRVSAFLHSQDPERHSTNADYRIAKGSFRGTGTMEYWTASGSLKVSRLNQVRHGAENFAVTHNIAFVQQFCRLRSI
jgi:hypothetical protein